MANPVYYKHLAVHQLYDHIAHDCVFGMYGMLSTVELPQVFVT